ncbi:lipopolysaccharide biosynthesis protein [Aliarcobacter butzleri]|uniref:lipopolysaccharide biosynthesis protein n=1 Tax=Aliarcobacter butzleri TaxID=28197 RepID=UPI0021B4CC13|nr:lipopolysaccharide biosynthesis protein [Aliarcobacter butzleri]MCT7599791.1 lipopolysaccharide biosynthesis protein [Aliarcobacter butzleri]
MQETSLKKRYSIKLLANIISGIIGAIIVAIVPKALGPIAFGQFVYLQEFFTKVIGFLDMGSSIAFFTKLSARADRKELITFYFLYSFLVLLLIFGFIFASDAFGIISYMIPDISTEYIYLGLFFGFFTWFTQIFIKISDAYALTVSVELIKVGHKIVSLLVLLFFVYQLAFDLELFFYFHYISLVSFLLIITWLFIKKGIFQNILNSQFSILNLSKEFIEYCHPLVVYSIVGLLAGLFDIWLLQKVAGSEQMGFYGLAYSLAAMCFLFTSAMTPIITREFSKSYEEKDFENMRKLFYRYIPMLYSIAAFFSVFISIQSENVLAIFTDEKFKDAYLVLVLMAFYPIHQTYGQLSGSIFYAASQTKLYRNIGIFSALLSILFAFIFIYIFELGAVGLALTMLIVQVIGTNIQLYFNSKLLKLNIKYFIFHQMYSILFFTLIAIFVSKAINIENSILEFLFSGFLYTILVIIFSYIFPQVFATNRDEIKEQFYKVKEYVTKK